MILGLPEVTVYVFIGAVAFIFLLLVLWGVFFPKVRDN